jgi:hypothetical protein
VLAGLALAPSVPFDAQEASAGLTNGNGNGNGARDGMGTATATVTRVGLAARLHGLAAGRPQRQRRPARRGGG